VKRGINRPDKRRFWPSQLKPEAFCRRLGASVGSHNWRFWRDKINPDNYSPELQGVVGQSGGSLKSVMSSHNPWP